MKKTNLQSKKGSLLLIFLFSVGAFAVILGGAYFIVSNSLMTGGELERQANKQRLELAADVIFRSELERGSKDFITNGSVPTITYTAGNYQTLLTNALNWGVKSNMLASMSGLTVTLPNTTTNPPFAKDNAISSDGTFAASPLSRFPGYHAGATVSATLTPADSSKPFSYSRTYTFYKEIPLAYFPFYAAYPFNGAEELYSHATEMVNQLGVMEGVYGFDIFSALIYGGGVTHYPGWTNPSLGLEAIGIEPDYQYPGLYNSLGVDALELSKYYASSANAVLNRQNYSLDPNAIVVQFDGSSLSVLSAPVGGTTVPAAMTVGSFQGLNRAIIDMSTLPVTGNYAYRKWYIYCSTNDAKAAGVVIDDDSVTPAANTVSIATDGHVYYKGRSASDERTPMVIANNYGAVGFCNENYGGSGTSATSLDVTSYGFLSTYAKEGLIIHDIFNRNGSLASDTPDTVNTESLTWGAVTGTLDCTTANGGAVLVTNTSGSCPIAVPTGCKETAAITITCSFGFTGADTRRAQIFLSAGAPYSTTENLMFQLDAGTTNNFIYAAHTGSTTDQDVSTMSVNVPSGTPVTLEMTYMPAIGRIIIKNITAGTLLLDKRMSVFPSWSSSRIPGYITLALNAGASSSAAAGQFKVTKQKYGTLFHSPHTGSSETLLFYGGLALGDQWGNLLGTDPIMTFSNSLSWGDVVAPYTERIIVNHPYYREP